MTDWKKHLLNNTCQEKEKEKDILPGFTLYTPEKENNLLKK